MKKTCTVTSKLEAQVRKLKRFRTENDIIKRLSNNSKAEMSITLQDYNKMLSTLRSKNNKLVTRINNMEDGGTLVPLNKNQQKNANELQHLKDQAGVNLWAKQAYLQLVDENELTRTKKKNNKINNRVNSCTNMLAISSGKLGAVPSQFQNSNQYQN